MQVTNPNANKLALVDHKNAQKLDPKTVHT